VNAQGSYAEIRAYLENAPVPRLTRKWGPEDAIPTEYKGITFRSILEAAWARTLDHYEIAWEYEPETVRLASGKRYVPDFRLDELDTFIEAKGPHMLRTDKTSQFAKEGGAEVIVLLGFYPLSRYLGPATRPGSMQWLDPLGYDTRFTRCGECSAWQWLRPQLSRRCRRCNAVCGALLAKSGEMSFIPAQDDPYTAPSWFGGALHAMVPARRLVSQPP
jgi:hypothetical protein